MTTTVTTPPASPPPVTRTGRRGPGSLPPLVRYVLVRIGTGVVTLLAVSVLVFFGANLLPGNAAEVALGVNTGDPAALQAALQAAGLDQPVVLRYWSWLTGLLQGDLGVSMVTHQPVADLVGSRLRNTLVLTGCLLVLLVPVAVVLGTWSAMRKDTLIDRVVGTGTMWFLATPEFVIGTFLVVIFASWLKVLPSVSLLNPRMTALEQPNLLVLPVLTMLIVGAGQVTRLVRASTIDVLQSDFVQMAVLRGVPARTLLLRHVLPNSLGPSVQVLGLAMGSLIGGVVVIETVFNYPGVGTMLVEAVSTRDITTVASLTILLSAAYILSNLIADLVAMVLNPQLRRGGAF
ncbi:peptide/nickel transport system permease protein [Arthrobacter sp. OV608]|nr:peptide/nickel transport system permease protein [Arthrobacter sp. OV608]